MFTTTTPKEAEGFNISYSTEERCAEKLLALLPEGWTVHFEWAQIMMSDVQYEVDRDKKRVEILYNQNLSHWFPFVLKEVTEKATPAKK